ncbi:uncharacterized protein LOC132267464 [Cornus florida]|uniref:uncharacterized protein LOC132267464 n=1 Tax=Cornus florida TaxID=4283 RepID=UPI0028A29FC0|nr:uncharacterized protein LOC132267464 [Cornus florida]
MVNGPWMAMGDWNSIRFFSDKRGGRKVPQRLLNEFNDCLQDAGLTEVHPTNGDWSWCNRRQISRRIYVKLDRVFLNESWLDNLPGTKVMYTAATCSDYYGLAIHISKEFAAGLKQFKLLKLRLVKTAIKEWNKNCFGDVGERLIQSKQKLNQLQLQHLIDPNDNNFQAEQEARDNYQAAVVDHEILIAKKSRILWLKDTDRCTGYVYNKMKQHRNFNAITIMEHENGQTTSDLSLIRSWFIEFYHNLFAKKNEEIPEVIHTSK